MKYEEACTCNQIRCVCITLTDDQSHIVALTKDLVRLSILSNNVIAQGQFKGEISDEVSQLLNMCQDIYKLYVKEDESAKVLAKEENND